MSRTIVGGLVLIAILLLSACSSGSGPLVVVPVDPPPTSPPGGSPPPPPPPAPDPGPTPPPPSDDLAGGVLASFKTEGIGPDQQPFTETFAVWVTNEQTISDLFDILAGIGANRIVAGIILAGPGKADHNAPYSWHLDPENTQMVDFAMEVCDGRPSYVEDHLDDFLSLGQYCPWASVLVSVEDHR